MGRWWETRLTGEMVGDTADGEMVGDTADGEMVGDTTADGGDGG